MIDQYYLHLNLKVSDAEAEVKETDADRLKLKDKLNAFQKNLKIKSYGKLLYVYTESNSRAIK